MGTCSDILPLFLLTFSLRVLYKYDSKAVSYENYTANYKNFRGA